MGGLLDEDAGGLREGFGEGANLVLKERFLIEHCHAVRNTVLG